MEGGRLMGGRLIEVGLYLVLTCHIRRSRNELWHLWCSWLTRGTVREIVLPKNTTKWSLPGIEPRLLDPEASALTIIPSFIVMARKRFSELRPCYTKQFFLQHATQRLQVAKKKFTCNTPFCNCNCCAASCKKKRTTLFFSQRCERSCLRVTPPQQLATQFCQNRPVRANLSLAGDFRHLVC